MLLLIDYATDNYVSPCAQSATDQETLCVSANFLYCGLKKFHGLLSSFSEAPSFHYIELYLPRDGLSWLLKYEPSCL